MRLTQFSHAALSIVSGMALGLVVGGYGLFAWGGTVVLLLAVSLLLELGNKP